MYRHYFTGVDADAYNNEAGDVIRGVADNELSAEYMLSLNLEFPFRALRFAPSELFHVPKLRVINFELFLSPFFDAALVKESDRARHPESLFGGAFAAGAGIEFLVFPDIMRSLYIRASFGYNLHRTESVTDWGDVFIGIGHFY